MNCVFTVNFLSCFVSPADTSCHYVCLLCVCVCMCSGQSLLSLLIDYGRLSHVSSLATPVPVVKETINEAGPLESFEWMKKMVWFFLLFEVVTHCRGMVVL